MDFESLTDAQKAAAVAEFDQNFKTQDALRLLNTTDWKVIRELERKYLSGTTLNVERDALREQVVHPATSFTPGQ